MDPRQYCSQARFAPSASRRARRYVQAGFAALALTAALTGCGTDRWGFPYRASVQQGNWVTQEQIAQLKEGMTRDQVRFVLGSPTLADALHADRWDYPYLFKPGHGDPQTRRFTVWFQNDAATKWSGDEQPDEQPFQLDKSKADAAVKRALDSVSEDAKAAPKGKSVKLGQ